MKCSVETRKSDGATLGTGKMKTATNDDISEKVRKRGEIFFIWSSGFSDVQVIPKFNIKIKVTHQAPAVQKVDSAIHWTNLCSVDNAIGHFTVVCSVPLPSNRSEAGGNLVLLQIFLFFICKPWYSHTNNPVNMIIYI